MKEASKSAIARIVLGLTLLLAPLAAGAHQVYPIGTDPATTDLTDTPGAVPHEDGWAIELGGERPDWFTPTLEQEVLAAGGQPVAAPNDAPLPSEVGIRPGAWMISPSGCTMNFVFTKGGAYAIGTAGHCVEKTGEPVVILTLTPGSNESVLLEIGKVLAFRDNGIGDDFALVSVRPELNSWVSGTMALIGGPCGQYTGSGPETVWHYGHGLAIGTGGTPRSGVSLNWTNTAYGWDGAGIFGDSGSGVRVTDLKAAGNLTHLVVDTRWLPSYIAGTRISRMLQIAKGWALVNSGLCL